MSAFSRNSEHTEAQGPREPPVSENTENKPSITGAERQSITETKVMKFVVVYLLCYGT